MEERPSPATGFWRRLAENAGGSLIGFVISAAGSALIGPAWAKLKSIPLAKGFYVSALLFGVYLLGLGVYLTVRRLRQQGTKVSTKAPAAQDLPQKLTVRILDAIAGDESVFVESQGDLGIYLRVRVVNRTLPAVTVTMWKLDLFHGDEHWRIGFEQKLFGNPEFRRLGTGKDDMKKESVGQAFEKSPIDAGASPEGWLKFGVPSTLLHHVFGATVHLRALDDGGNTSSCTLPPGEWLSPVQLKP